MLKEKKSKIAYKNKKTISNFDLNDKAQTPIALISTESFSIMNVDTIIANSVVYLKYFLNLL